MVTEGELASPRDEAPSQLFNTTTLKRYTHKQHLHTHTCMCVYDNNNYRKRRSHQFASWRDMQGDGRRGLGGRRRKGKGESEVLCFNLNCTCMWVGKRCYWADVSSALCSGCSPALSLGLDRCVQPSPSCPNISWENNKWGGKQRADSVQPNNGQKWRAGQMLALTTLTQRKPSKMREVTNVWTVATWRGKHCGLD